jgi:hypothetical protein
MKKSIKPLWLAMILLVFSASPGMASKPGQDVNPNGFPSGFHYNLNIHAKNANFVCDYSRDEFGQVTYGNVINVPDYTPNGEIKMLSGKGKKAEQFTELLVTDPCAGFPDDRNLTNYSYATLQLPKNELGYDVYARPLGKPSKGTVERNITIVPELSQVIMEEMDADGNPIVDVNGNPVTTELIYLGLVTDRGFYTPTKSLERSGKKSVAVPLTGLFLWSGDVCYFDSTGYCNGDCTSREICCASETQIIDGIAVELYTNCEDATPDMLGEMTCRDVDLASGELPLFPVTVDCKTYEDHWVFNIADLVEYIWQVDSNVKQFNVRFYPRTDTLF